jgi:hypothetical protein
MTVLLSRKNSKKSKKNLNVSTDDYILSKYNDIKSLVLKNKTIVFVTLLTSAYYVISSLK